MLTTKELSAWLNIKPSTLYLWASQKKIPCCRIHGLIRFDPDAIQAWLNCFGVAPGKPPSLPIRHVSRDLDQLIEAAKREVYTPRHGETRPKSGLVKRGNVWWMNMVFQGQRIRRSTGSSNRALADAIMAKVKVQLIEGQYFDRAEEQSRTFKELMDRFEREHLVKLASRQTGQVFVKRFRAFFGDRTLGEITPKLIVEYKSLRYAAGVKPASINRELTCLRKAFNLAKREWEWCRDNPVSRVSLEKGATKRDRWLMEDEEARLLDACPSWLRELVVFALHSGMRLGEILSLTWTGVDLFRRTATVFESKNGERRTVPLNQTLMALLTEKAKVRHIKTALVFPSLAGTRLDPNHLRRQRRAS